MENRLLPTTIHAKAYTSPVGVAAPVRPGTRGISSPLREERRRQREGLLAAEITITSLTVRGAQEDTSLAQQPDLVAGGTTGPLRRPTSAALAFARLKINLAVACGHHQSPQHRIPPRVPVLPLLLRSPAGYPLLFPLRGTPLLLRRSRTIFRRKPWGQGGDTGEKGMSEMSARGWGWPSTSASGVAAAAAVFGLPITVAAAAAICQAWVVIVVEAASVSTVAAALQACFGRIESSNGEAQLFKGEKLVSRGGRWLSLLRTDEGPVRRGSSVCVQRLDRPPSAQNEDTAWCSWHHLPNFHISRAPRAFLA